MTKKQIERFVKKVSPYDNVDIYYIYDDSKNHYFAVAKYWMPRFLKPWRPLCQIHINEYCLPTSTDLFIKGALLHEVGHFVIRENMPQSLKEFKVHSWAVEKAESLGMVDVKRELVKSLRDWQYVNWNSRFRSHRLAYKLALKDKKWAKKHGLLV